MQGASAGCGNQTYGGTGRGPHALATAGGITYNYDANGNVTGTTGGTARAITWDGSNMATKVVDGSTTGNTKYFVGDTLVRKDEGGTTTYYVPGMRKEGGSWRKMYGNLAERSPDGNYRFYHSDHLGSSTLATGVSGNPQHRALYFPFGGDRTVAGSFTPKY